MSRYLEDAAEQLRKAAEAVDRQYANANLPTAANEYRERIANGFATLAAIERGLLPASVVEAVVEAILTRNTP